MKIYPDLFDNENTETQFPPCPGCKKVLTPEDFVQLFPQTHEQFWTDELSKRKELVPIFNADCSLCNSSIGGRRNDKILG